ncbi:Mu-like prophage major head subunit gpT family protein [Candidatus Pacearchaeota archaeon]|jgi:phage major head subunit gpT-like protein|nr:Mu-like prophage major head subunit gpT family protein [Candidatus Pacearchaeota archaeon]
MSVDLKVLEAIKTNFLAIFTQALGEKANTITELNKIMTVLPVDKANKVVLSWFGVVPPMEEWKDERKMSKLPPYEYTIDIKDWANGLELLRTDIDDDKLGQYPARIAAMATAYYKLLRKTFFGLLNGGATTYKAYDGGYMFANTRTIGKSSNIDNLIAGTYHDTEAHIRDALAAAVTAMGAFEDDWGDPLGLVPDTIVCSPDMMIPITTALWLPGVAGTERPEKAYVENIIQDPNITSGSAKDWFVLCTKEAIKPLIMGDRKKPEFTSLDLPTSPAAFSSKKFLYGADARFGYGFGDPRTAIMIDSA